MATKVEEGGYEVEESLGKVGPELSGLRNLAAMPVGAEPDDMAPAGHEAILQSIIRYERRIKALKAHKATGEALMADGHPNMPPTAIDPVALASINKDAASVTLAARTFISDAIPEGQAARLDLQAGAIEPKP